MSWLLRQPPSTGLEAVVLEGQHQPGLAGKEGHGGGEGVVGVNKDAGSAARQGIG